MWHGTLEFNILAKNTIVSGLSPLYPDVHCVANDDVCEALLG